eukprot:813797_1
MRITNLQLKAMCAISCTILHWTLTHCEEDFGITGISLNDKPSGMSGVKNKNRQIKSKTHKKYKKKKKKHAKPRVNYFMAWRIRNPELCASLGDVQSTISDALPPMRRLLIDPSTFHITLTLLCLETPEQVEAAKLAVHGMRPEFMDIVPETDSVRLYVKDLGHFNNKVLFAKVDDSEGKIPDVLAQLFRMSSKSFEKAGLYTDRDPFKPHITLLKMSRLSKLKKSERQELKNNDFPGIPPSTYARHKDQDFGREAVNCIELCAMKRCKADGYYEVIASVGHECAFSQQPKIEH